MSLDVIVNETKVCQKHPLLIGLIFAATFLTTRQESK